MMTADDGTEPPKCVHCGATNPVGGLTQTTRRADMEVIGSRKSEVFLCEICMDSLGTMRWIEGDAACGEAIDRARVANTIRDDIRKLVRLIVSGRPV